MSWFAWLKPPPAMPKTKIQAIAKDIQKVEQKHGVQIVAAFAEFKRQPAGVYQDGKAK